MQAYRLIPHPANDPVSVTGVEVRVKNSDPSWLTLRWRVDGAQQLLIPPIGSKSRADELWRSTCFEVFLKPSDGDGYQEWNLSPARKWNAYNFDSYRDGMRELEAARAPDCVWHGGRGFALFDAAIPRKVLPSAKCAMALSAVIEEEGGRITYWAIAHPDADRPDFHHSACFAAALDPRECQ